VISDDGRLADPFDSTPGGRRRSLHQAIPPNSAGAKIAGGERRGAEVPERVDWGYQRPIPPDVPPDLEASPG
jgi:hypothetical protein